MTPVYNNNDLCVLYSVHSVLSELVVGGGKTGSTRIAVGVI